MTSVVFSIGSNIGDRAGYIRKMEAALIAILDTPVSKSSLMETEPLGMQGNQPWFLNRIISGVFRGEPLDLLTEIEKIENDLGRDNKCTLESRTADIDILLFGDKVIQKGDLIVPHRAILKRRFCLEGMNQLIPQWHIPGTGKTVRQHFEQMEPSVRAQQILFLKD